MTVRLSDDEAWDYVSTCTTAMLTTLRRDGFPVTLPVWFVVDDRTLFVQAPGRSKKVVRVRRDPRASVLVESGERWAELKAVSFCATAELVTDPAVRHRMLDLLAEKYRSRRQSAQTMPAATARYYAGAVEIIRLTPHGSLLSWDNSQIRLVDSEATAAGES